MATDPDARVRFQLLLTLGYVETPRAAKIRDEILFADIDDEWMQIAALSAPAVQEGALLETVLDEYQPSYASFVRRLSMLAAAHRTADRVRMLLEEATRMQPASTTFEWQAPVLEGVAQGLRARGELSLDVRAVVSAFFDHPSPQVREAALGVLETTGLPSDREAAVSRAAGIARDTSAAAERREQAVRILALDDASGHATLFTDLATSTEPASVQAAAFRALGDVPGTQVSTLAVERWPALMLEVRDAALNAILARPFDLDRIKILLDALEAGRVQPANLGWGDQVTLMRDIPDAMKQRARALITGPAELAREATAAYVREVRALASDPEAGRAVFFQACSRCHALGDIAPAAEVGPDLMSVRGWTTPDLIDQIVQPSKALARGYELWQLTLDNGESVEGMIASETANALTMRDAYGRLTTYARRDIRTLNNLNASAMPADFRETLSRQQMADLVAFIRVGN
jgi:putative heme-binding domain-containing protein